MNKQNKAIIGLGSNRNEKENMVKAVELLQRHFETISFSKALYTAPIGVNPDVKPFLNQVAIIQTLKDLSEVQGVLKNIEYELGRRPQDKQCMSIPIDIDLLQWNEQVYKEEDMKRDYIIAAIQSLSTEGKDNKRS